MHVLFETLRYHKNNENKVHSFLSFTAVIFYLFIYVLETSLGSNRVAGIFPVGDLVRLAKCQTGLSITRPELTRQP